jgi:hypothetical protein
VYDNLWNDDALNVCFPYLFICICVCVCVCVCVEYYIYNTPLSAAQLSLHGKNVLLVYIYK